MIFAMLMVWVDRFRLAACALFLCLLYLSAAHSNTAISKIVRDKDSVGIILGTSASGSGTFCVGASGSCVSVKIVDGLGVTNLSSQHDDLIYFKGEGALSKMVAMSAGTAIGNWQWLEKVALVIAGGLLGFVSNTLFSIVQFRRETKIEQSSILRGWRDKCIGLAKTRKMTGDGDLVAARPEALSRNNILRVAEIEARLREIQSETSVKPEKNTELCNKADRLLMELKA